MSILLVCNEPSFRVVLGDLLREAGYEVDVCRDLDGACVSLLASSRRKRLRRGEVDHRQEQRLVSAAAAVLANDREDPSGGI